MSDGNGHLVCFDDIGLYLLDSIGVRDVGILDTYTLSIPIAPLLMELFPHAVVNQRQRYAHKFRVENSLPPQRSAWSSTLQYRTLTMLGQHGYWWLMGATEGPYHLANQPR
jgi:hypothetical protein